MQLFEQTLPSQPRAIPARVQGPDGSCLLGVPARERPGTTSANANRNTSVVLMYPDQLQWYNIGQLRWILLATLLADTVGIILALWWELSWRTHQITSLLVVCTVGLFANSAGAAGTNA